MMKTMLAATFHVAARHKDRAALSQRLVDVAGGANLPCNVAAAALLYTLLEVADQMAEAVPEGKGATWSRSFAC